MTAERALWISQDVAILGALIFLFRQQLPRLYPAWTVFLSVQLCRDAILQIVPMTGILWVRIFTVSEYISIVFLVVVVLAWSAKFFGHYVDADRAIRALFRVAIAISLLASIASLRPDLSGIDWASPALSAAVLTRRVTDSVLLGFVAIALLAWRFYRVKVRENSKRHAAWLIAYLLVNAVSAFLADSGSGHLLRALNLATAVGNTAVYLAGIFVLTSRGERLTLDTVNEEDLDKASEGYRMAVASGKRLSRPFTGL